jgi:Lamin Tail Domain/PEP-CTERM motif
MKKTLLALSLLVTGLTVGHAQIIITEVDPTGSSTSTYAADWFELTNYGSSAVSLTGWSMDDNSDSISDAVPLTGVSSIAPGQSVVFIEDTSASSDAALNASFETAWFGSKVPAGFTIGNYGGSGVGLSSSSDEVNIFNASGTQVTGVSFGKSTTGVSFDNSVAKIGDDSTISTLSSAGKNNAFVSPTGEIGSPGSVPEPTTYAMLVAGLLALVGVQMRRRMGADVRR